MLSERKGWGGVLPSNIAVKEKGQGANISQTDFG